MKIRQCVCVCVCVSGERETFVSGNNTDCHEYIIMFIVIKRSGLQGKCLWIRIIQQHEHSSFQDSGRN